MSAQVDHRFNCKGMALLQHRHGNVHGGIPLYNFALSICYVSDNQVSRATSSKLFCGNGLNVADVCADRMATDQLCGPMIRLPVTPTIQLV